MSWSLHTETKICKGPCGLDLPLESFGNHSSTKDRKRPKCKDCTSAENAARNKANPEAGRRTARAWYHRNREHAAAQSLQYAREHREQRRAYDSAYGKANPNKVREKTSRRRALKRTTEVEPVCYESILEQHGPTCHICNKAIDVDLRHPSPQSLSFDHVIPLSRGGGHIASNIKPSHLLCNMQKGAAV